MRLGEPRGCVRTVRDYLSLDETGTEPVTSALRPGVVETFRRRPAAPCRGLDFS